MPLGHNGRLALRVVQAFLLDGDRWYRWIETHAPISRRAVRRLANAFEETGHGLIVGMAGAGIAQATVATIVYVLIGVPQPFALGCRSCASSGRS